MTPSLIGLFGGTFDPIHEGHLSSAEAAMKAHDLSRVIFVPAGDPYLKSDSPDWDISPAEYRVEMVRLALEHHGNPRFELSEMETQRGGPSYTLDTARLLSVANPQSEVVVILGMDAVLGMPLWKDPTSLLSEFKILAITRPGFDESELPKLPLNNEFDAIEIVDANTPDISASEIRKMISNSHADLPSLETLCPAVEKLIREQALYK